MAPKHKESLIKKIDYENKVIYFDQSDIKKITASKLAKVLGKNKYDSTFSAACDISGIYSGRESNKYTDAGNVLEPVIRSYLRANTKDLLGRYFDLSADDIIGIEEPISGSSCGHDHFPEKEIFGGMVDGYVLINGKRVAVLEIKTSSKEYEWVDEKGTRNRVPDEYVLQASLYAKLGGLDKIVYVAGFLRENHYDDPHNWTPCSDNCAVIVTDRADISESLDIASEWYNEHMAGGVTPPWDESNEEDLKIVDALTSLLQPPPKKELEELMKEYVRIEDEISKYKETTAIISKLEKEQKSLKDDIKPYMVEMFVEGQKKVMVDHDGRTFVLQAKEEKEINKEKLKNDGLYDTYVEKKITYSLLLK